MFNLRPYQEEARDAVLREWEQGHRRTLLVLPTGCGKTVVFSDVAKHQADKGDRILVMAHRGELLSQAAEKLKSVAGLDSVLEKAGSTGLGSPAPVTVGSVQTLCREKRLARFPENYFGTVIVDEAHHALSESYRRVLDHFPGANVLGVTATPDRGDRRSLGRFFDSLAYEYPMNKAIQDGFLCPVKAQMIPLELDIHDVGLSSGDFAAEEIGSALDPYLEQIASEMQKTCTGRKTVVFLPLVKTSQRFAALLNRSGLRACEINGESVNRAAILEDFQAGKYDVLCNSMLLTEGWDCPAVDCVVVLRPTRVRGLYQQMVGRGMRLSPGKDHLLLLDFLWLTEQHDLCRPSSLLSRDEKIARKIDETIRASEGGFDLIEAEEKAVRDLLAEREKALANQLAVMRSRTRRLVDPIQYALSIADEDLSNYEPSFPWEMAPPSEKQLAYLEKCGIHAGSVSCMGLASQIIERLKLRQDAGLSTPKQIRLLERYGFRQVGTWRFETASQMISRIADNNWVLPRGMNPEYENME